MTDTTPWHLGRMLSFDLETTSVDPHTARIVTACVAHVEAGQDPRVTTWLVDPGVEIPDEDAAVHGITTEHARQHGDQPGPVVDVLADELVAAWSAGRPVIIMNAAYDLTVLEAELARHE